MAGPLNGLGGQQQVPIANTFQQSQPNTDLRQRENVQAQEEIVQPQGTEAAQVQSSEARDSDSGLDLRNDGDIVQAESQQRGSVIDILV